MRLSLFKLDRKYEAKSLDLAIRFPHFLAIFKVQSALIYIIINKLILET